MKKYIIKLLLFFNLIINTIIFLILLIILLISSYALYDSYQIYESTKIEEIDIKEDIVKDVNENVKAWIKIDNTDINYPIVKGKDNMEYLNKNYKGEYSFSGSIFLDYRNNDFNDEYSIIYGHSFKKGGMFSDIKKYLNKEYFDSHLNGTLYLMDKEYSINVIMISRVKYNDEIYDLSNIDNNYIISYLMKKSVNKTKIIEKNNKLLILSTCSSTSKSDRLVLVTFLK